MGFESRVEGLMKMIVFQRRRGRKPTMDRTEKVRMSVDVSSSKRNKEVVRLSAMTLHVPPTTSQ